MAAALMALMLVTFCSIAILNVESVEAANIKTAEDAVWWSLVTIATVGYGDRYPVTTEGRMIAVVLMSGGVALYGVFSGFLASWFVGEDNSNAELAAVKDELARLRELLEQRRP
jgi:voltage-gated potassium channel